MSGIQNETSALKSKLKRADLEELSTDLKREDIQPRTINWDILPERSDLKSDEIFIHRLSRLPDIRKRYSESLVRARVGSSAKN
jgi:hypothetical protein